jgi:hypothetical protein
MAKHKLWAMAAAAGISAVLLAGCDDPGGGESPGIDESEYDDNAGIDDDLKDDSAGEEQPSDEATEPSE